MRVSVLLSFLLHTLLTFTFRDAFSSLWTREDIRVYNVELIRPPVEETDGMGQGDADLAKSDPEEKPLSSEESQDTISLDTTDKRYVSYAGATRGGSLSPPFRSHITVARLNIKASFDYRIKAKK